MFLLVGIIMQPIIGLDTIARISILDSISKCEIIKDSKCQSCVQAKQHQKPFKRVEVEKKLGTFRSYSVRLA
jgi:hypothetical protein